MRLHRLWREAAKLNNDKALRLIGMALRARRLEVGYDPSIALVASGRAKLALAASDASDRVKSHIRQAAENTDTQYVEAPFDRYALGRALGRAECAAVATNDAGFAKAVTGALTESGENNTEVTSI